MSRIFKLLQLAVVIIVGVSFTGCSLDDPTTSTDVNGSLRLSSITVAGNRLLSVDYDSQKRVVGVDGAAQFGFSLSVDYNPMTITTVLYDDDNYDYDYDSYYADEKIVLSDIKLNKQGFVESAWYDTYSMNESGNWTLDEGYYDGNTFVPASGTITFTYDSDGHLIKTVDAYFETVTYNWSNGNLISFVDDGCSWSFTYSSTPNTRNQWSVCWGNLYFMLTGLFGNAPANLVASINLNGETSYYAYQLNSGGYIEKEQGAIDGEQLVLTYNYMK